MKKTILTLAWLLTVVAMFFAGRGCGTQTVTHTTIRVDTVFVRDTIRDTVPVPKTRLVVRTDTVLLKIPGDTVRVAVEVPVERKVYETDYYRAVVEGFRPALVEMEVYRKNAHITSETTLQREILSGRRHSDRSGGRWGAGIQAGYGITPKGPAPYIGVGIHYNLITW